MLCLGPVPVVVPQPEPHSVGGVLVHMPHVCSVGVLLIISNSTIDQHLFKQQHPLFHLSSISLLFCPQFAPFHLRTLLFIYFYVYFVYIE